MVFNSYIFFLFFIVVFAFYQLPASWRIHKFALLCASYVFYGAWDPPFVVLLLLSTFVSWITAEYAAPGVRPKLRIAAVYLGVTCNLGLVIYYKYARFFAEAAIALLSNVGFSFEPPGGEVLLPVGISFFTFQSLSYTLDVYRGRAEPCRSFLDYSLYVAFFPQLVAGPIVRATDFLPQCQNRPVVTLNHVSWGLNLLLIGLFQKIVVADGVLATIVAKGFCTDNAPGTIASWLASIAFAGQIFCDFAGYSTAAIGVAMCFGFALPDNFRCPYASVGFSEFWRRWHVSLSTWLRDYLYIPLGGNRLGPLVTYRNMMITMLLGGLWHGASWNFIIWGGLHGVYLVIERLFKSSAIGRSYLWGQSALRFLLWVVTFGLTCVTWVFFRAETLPAALSRLYVMVLPDFRITLHPFSRWEAVQIVIVMGCLLAVHFVGRNSTLEDLSGRLPSWVIGGLNSLMLCSILMMPGSDRAFIYFQF